jgi:type I restriction enzyme, S subunit
MNTAKVGYQQTEVGIIPEDWEVVTVGDVFDFIKTYSNSRKDLSDIGDVEYLHYGDIHTKYKYHLDFDRYVLPKISSEKFKVNIEYAKNGDLFVADASEDYADIGKSVEIVNLHNKKVVSGLHTFLLRDKGNSFSNGYKGFVFYNQNVSRTIKKIATGTSVLGISKTNLWKLKIPLPPKPEQQKIAEILTTWDKAIEKQSSLIAQKQQLKKGLMQKIFSQEVRFKANDGSDFPDWKDKKLGDVGIRKASNISANELENNNGDYKIYGASGYLKSIDFYTEEDFYVAIVKDGAGVSRISLLEPKTSVLGTLAIIKAEQGSDIHFLYWLIQTINFNKYIVGSTIPHIYYRDYKTENIRIPSLEEQVKIAELLITFDDEIAKLEQELNTLKAQKKGLMQKLLTGQIRVTIN